MFPTKLTKSAIPKFVEIFNSDVVHMRLSSVHRVEVTFGRKRGKHFAIFK